MIIDRSKIPQPLIENHFKFPVIEQFKLSSGVPVLFIEKHNLPIINITVMAECGSKFDPAGKKGLAYLFTALTDEGAGSYSAFQLHDEFDFIGANFSISCDEDYIYYSVQTISEHLDKAIELLNAVITKPHLSEESFQREKQRILTRVTQQKDYPDDMADTWFINKLMGNESPYGYPVTGVYKMIEQIALNDIKDFYKTFINSKTISVAVTGDITLPDINVKLSSLMNGLSTSSEVKKPEYQFTDPDKKIYVIDFPAAAQTEIRIGCKFPARKEGNFYSRLIMNTVLGGQYSSRINQNLREEKGFTYGASSLINYWKNSAFFVVTTSVNTDNTGEAVKEILSELRGIKKGVTAEEVDFAKSTLVKKFPLFFETYNQLNSNLAVLFKHNLKLDYFNCYADEINKTSIEEINMAAGFIDLEKSVYVLAGDLTRIKDQLKDFEGKELVEINRNESLVG